MSAKPSVYEIALLAVVIAVLLWSGISPKDRFTWFMEVFPVLIAVPILLVTRQRFQFIRDAPWRAS